MYKINNLKNYLILFLTLIVIVLICSNSCTRRKLEYSENNVKALNDTLHTYVLENGEMLNSKQMLILEKNQLEEFLDISKKERKEIEKKLESSLAYISKMETKVKIDTLVLTDSVFIENGITNISFKYKDEWVYMDGITKFKDLDNTSTTLNNMSMSVPLELGITDNNQFFAVSKNPYIVITDVNGAKILTNKNKPKRWCVGPTITVGIGYGCGTDFNGGNIKKGLIVGVMGGFSVTYNLLK